jgi:hypothetical protein
LLFRYILTPPQLSRLFSLHFSLSSPILLRPAESSLAMAKNTCKLCARRFASPRALAGHMRSHSLAAAAAAAAKQQKISSASSASTADADVGSKKPASIYMLRENPKRSLRAADGSLWDRESEAESTPPRAKRASPPSAWGEAAEPVSSLSEAATPEEDVALTLMKMSRDSWPSDALVEVDYSDDGSDDDGYAPPPPPRRPAPAPAPMEEKRTQFPCAACRKVFRSYQALGGHRASNVRGGLGGYCAPLVAPAPPPSPLSDECPYCYRFFASSQALGSHKQPHACGAAAVAAQQQQAASALVAPPSPTKNPGMIDLNVEPPSEEVELSAVSDPHFNSGS